MTGKLDIQNRLKNAHLILRQKLKPEGEGMRIQKWLWFCLEKAYQWQWNERGWTRGRLEFKEVFLPCLQASLWKQKRPGLPSAGWFLWLERNAQETGVKEGVSETCQTSEKCCLRCSPGIRIASGSDDSKIRIWDIKSSASLPKAGSRYSASTSQVRISVSDVCFL